MEKLYVELSSIYTQNETFKIICLYSNSWPNLPAFHYRPMLAADSVVFDKLATPLAAAAFHLPAIHYRPMLVQTPLAVTLPSVKIPGPLRRTTT